MRQVRPWIVGAMVYPIAVTILAFIFPGPDKQILLQHYFDKPAYDAVLPPVDTGVRGELTVSDNSGSSRVFWEQPKPGKVDVTIEVPASSSRH